MARSTPRPKQPLNEVFGFPPFNSSERARSYRQNRRCPFNNPSGANCTKSSKTDPIGVCSLKETETTAAIVCPIRFREDYKIADHTAEFFFPPSTLWTSFTEVPLKDVDGSVAGKLDLVLVSYDQNGRVADFGVVEVQSVYVTGSTRQPFKYYMEDPATRFDMDWSGQPSDSYPKPDPRSSMNKRLVPQLISEGAILREWGKKLAVVTHQALYRTLPAMPVFDETDADLAWFLYDLDYSETEELYHLALKEKVYTRLQPAMEAITRPRPGPIEEFVALLQSKLDAHFETNENDNTLDDAALGDLSGVE